MFKRVLAFSMSCVYALLIASLVHGGEVRKLGANDLEWGTGTTTSPGGKVVTRINASHIIIPGGDNTLSLDNAVTAWIDVRAYGAVANDNTKGAVNTAAFQKAADALKPLVNTDITNPLSGGTIIVPAGEYRLASKVTIYSGTRLVGVSMEGTRISGEFSGAIIEMMPTTDNVEVSGTFIENLTIDGVDKSNEGWGVSVLEAANGGNATRQSGLRSVRIYNSKYGINLDASQDFEVYDSQIRYCTYGVWGTANDASGTGSAAQQVKFYNTDFRWNTTAVGGNYVAGSKPYQWLFIGCHVESNTVGVAWDSKTLTDVTFITTKFEGQDNEAVIISGAEGFKFYSCYFNGNAKTSKTQQILIDSGFGTTITMGNHLFVGCVWNGLAGVKDLSVQYSRNIRLISPSFLDIGEDTIENISSDVEITGIFGVHPPNPYQGVLRTAVTWITGADYPHKDFGILPRSSSTDNTHIYIKDIDIDVVEAFDNTSGTFVILQTGTEASAQVFAQGVDLLSEGVKEITWNNRGYHISPSDKYFRGTIVTDGAIDNTKGKAVVLITYIEVPVQP